VKEALSHLPQGLTKIYARIFDGIAAQSLGDREIAMECFRWVLYAKESIYGDFLLPALALLGSSSATLQELESKKLVPAYVSEACGNLLSIDEWSELKLIHFSVDEFLRKVLLSTSGGYWKDLGDRHNAEFVLACRCIDLLLLAGISSRSRGFAYAANNFDTHILGSIDGSADLPPGLRTRIDQLFGVDDGRLRWLLESRSVYEDEHTEPVSSSWLVWSTKLCNIPFLKTIWPNLARPKNALILAVQHGDISVLELLLSEGRDIHETDGRGWTALSHASLHNNQPAIDLLLQRGAMTNMSKVGTEVLHQAVINDNIELARRMLVAGADVNEADIPDGVVPLMLVHSLAMARMLCEEFKADPKIKDARGRNALFHLQPNLSADRSAAIFECLIKQGADVTATNTIGLNILDEAVQQDLGLEKVQFLLQHYPQLASKRENEWTALHWAFTGYYPILDSVKELICHGVNASTITTTHPPGSWTPWDLSIQYSTEWTFSQEYGRLSENEIHGLGGPTTSQTDAFAAKDCTSLDAAAADYSKFYEPACGICGAYIVRFP
jgi:ankyrin repeat protein